MKSKVIWVILVGALLMLHPAAQAFRFSVGGFGGLNFPVAQEDAKSGTVFGGKARVPLTTFLAVEPNYTYLKNSDAEIKVEEGWNTTMKHEGGKFNSFGVDLALGKVLGYKGFGAYAIFGISSAKFAKEGVPNLTKGSYSLGVGFEYGFTDQISLDLRGKALFFPYKDDSSSGGGTGSRKNGIITLGLNYYFGLSEK